MALQNIFNAKSKTRILPIKNRQTTCKNEDQLVEDYISELTCLAEEFHEAGLPLDEGELYLIALNMIDLTYDSFVIAQATCVDDIPFSTF